MLVNRRTFTAMTAVSVATAAVLPSQVRAAGRSSFKAIAFDGFPIIDPRPVFARVEEMFPGKGAELSALWRTRQFEYGWLRTLGGHYADFWRVTEDALVFAAKAMKIDLLAEQRDRLMQTYLELKAWPDVGPALRQLRDAGLRMAFLSNLTAPMLDAAIKNSGLEELLEPHLSTDRVQAFKPDARAYQMGVDAFGLPKEEIVFAAFAGWDVAGAKWFGYPTFWVNRANAAVEELGVAPDGMGSGLNDLVAFATVR
ncbi:haloacid dehalogenase type II [Bradyrhizobium sp. 6(2017)]|uniref:haloacid dehalogenase type II n=1 Tax=Bradyrhizobium sp. 6(2017) TaxID=1197460 RepID=UPI0013E16AE2|nr:haloacid dehalogenase type II [Bradyrhizobium sp. 6(2017)]QIG96286.1 haloacid dehalogenase type II [Bradyrhizobium sp. 6(2017)]